MNKILKQAIQETTEEIEALNYTIFCYPFKFKSKRLDSLQRLFGKLEHKKSILIKLAEKQEELK